MSENTKTELAIAQRNTALRTAIELAPRTLKKSPARDDSPKSTQSISTDQSSPNPFYTDEQSAAFMVDGVHYRIYDYFDIGIGRATPETVKKLSYIQNSAGNHAKTIEDALMLVHRLDRKLGMTDAREVKLHKIYSWLRIKNGKF